MKHVRMISLLLFVLLVVIVAIQNYMPLSTPVKFRVDLLFFDYESADIPLYFVAVIAFLVGLIFAAVYGISERFRLKKQIKTLVREAKEKEKELNSLRNLPVTGEDMSPDDAADIQ